MSAVATMLAASDAAACVQFAYDMTNISAGGVAAEMAHDAASIEIMRVVSRERVPAHRLYDDWSGPLYEYRLEAVDTLKGGSRHALLFTAPDVNWLADAIPGGRPFKHEPFWWLTPEGYAGLQRLSFYLADDFRSTTCARPVLFEMGEHYLVFTGQDGELLSPGFTANATPVEGVGQQRPVLERVHGESDPWLVAVRKALREVRR